ncbi:MAG: hypothetical protein HYZ10_05685 [Ignavibacteriales bacterium]|nr:MAG: hypothetical protein FD122_1498 [Stygiobacter sp.]KAF0217531.1 MAG: hypothetical protein FD178_575 [Ignavibacteria bacterium]MBI3123877.1 hypothetical protein [Ignavibacteriales bacterium]
MPDAKIGIVDKLVTVINDKSASKVANNFRYYRDHLRNKGLLKEDSYDWPNDSNIGKNPREHPIKLSKNEILQSSI